MISRSFGSSEAEASEDPSERESDRKKRRRAEG